MRPATALAALAALAVALVVVVAESGCAFNPLGFWSDDEPAGDPGAAGEGEGDAGAEGEGEGEGDPGVLAPCCDVDAVGIDQEALQLVLNGAGIAHVGVQDPFVNADTPRRFRLGVDAGSSFTMETLASNAGAYAPGLAFDAQSRLVMFSGSGGDSRVAISTRNGEGGFDSDTAFATFGNYVVENARIAKNPNGGFGGVVETVDCLSGPDCHYQVVLVDGDTGAWNQHTLASNDSFGLQDVGVADDGTIIAMWTQLGQVTVAELAPGASEPTQTVVAVGVSDFELAFAVGGDGTAHVVYGDFQGGKLIDVAGKGGAFSQRTLAEQAVTANDIAVAKDGTLFVPYIAADFDVHLIRSRGNLLDDVDVAPAPHDDADTAVDVRIAADGNSRPHFLVRSHLPTYLRPR